MTSDSEAALLTCREFIDFIADYRDDALPPGARRRFEEHLLACPDCVSYLESYSRSIELQGEAFDLSGSPPAGAPEELIAAILDARRRNARR